MSGNSGNESIREEMQILMVDTNDQIIGYSTKEICHKEPILHRAFSVFIYTGDKMLIQQRAIGKYHSGGLWTNACCSHPRAGQSIEEEVKSRLKEELGIVCECEEKFSFLYYHQFHNDLYEYEMDHVFIGEYNGEINENPAEVMNTKWISIEELRSDVLKHPERYTVWFIIALPKVLDQIEGQRLNKR